MEIKNFISASFSKQELVKKTVNFGQYEDKNGLKSSTYIFFQALCVIIMN